jgi:hypothetical protein
LGQVAFAPFACVEQIDRVMANAAALPDMVAALRGVGVDVIIA